MTDVIRDAVLVTGFALICAGAWVRFGPAGLIASGALLVAGTLLHVRGAS